MSKTGCHIGLLLVVALTALSSCSTKKNTATSRFWQAFNTRYNVYYHGKTNYDEQIKDMENDYEDDYSQHLFIHPAEARTNPKAPQPKGSFDRTIEKMQKAIALHSIKKKPKSGKGNSEKQKDWMRRTEYNPFIHNAWFLMAKAEYMKGEFLDAAATFRYISRNFTWLPTLCQEAQVWEALSYCALGWTTEADNVLAHVHIDKIDDRRVRSLANLAFADYYIKENRSGEAIPYLSEAAREAKGSQKVRLNFLLGQLYEDAGDRGNAYLAYKKAGSSSGSSYRTKFNARIKQSAVYQGDNIESEVRALKRMTRYDRNSTYLDQIYYAIGNLYLSRRDTVKAIDNYVLAAEKSTRNGIDKAISQLTLGGIYFVQRKYDKAQPCYAEALPQLSENYPNYKMLKHRSDVLDELAVYSGNVTLQDSLLRLSKMTPEEQRAVIKKIIDELKKKEKEDAEAAKRAEYLAAQGAKGTALKETGKAPASFAINDDNSWYFYNTATVNSGKTAFQQLWGSRKLEDHWRRHNKNTFNFNDDEQDEPAGNDSVPLTKEQADSIKANKEALKRSQDPHYEEFYLKQIPTTEEQIQKSNDVIQEGLYNMGVILKDKLEDFDAAAYEFNNLLERYPDNTYRLEVYYNLYLMYMRNGEVSRAEPYRQLILTNFADSKYGQALQDPNYIENLKNMNRYQEQLYAQAYSDYLNNNNEAVHAAYATMMERYPLSKIMPKFMFIDALSYVTQQNYDKFKEVLKDMLQRYPETDITPVATGIVKNLNAGRKLRGGGSNARGMLWSMRLTNDTTAEALERKFTPFKEDYDKPHVFVMLYPTDTVSSNILLYEVARHNFSSFVVKDYDLEQMTFGGRLGLLVVKGFANYDEVKHYRTLLENDTTLDLAAQVHPVIISVDNFNLLLNEGRSFEDYFDYLEGKNDAEHKAQEGTEAEDDEHQDTQVDGDGKVKSDGSQSKTEQAPTDGGDGSQSKTEQAPADGGDGSQPKTEQAPAEGGDGNQPKTEQAPAEGGDGNQPKTEQAPAEGGDGSQPKTEQAPADGPTAEEIAAEQRQQQREAEAEAKRKAEQEAQRKAAEEAKRKAEEEAQRKAAEEAQRRAAEEARKAEEQRQREEQERQERYRQELRHQHEEDLERQRAKAAKQEAKEEARRQAQAEKERLKLEQQREKQRQDSIEHAHKLWQDSIDNARKARQEAFKNAQKTDNDSTKTTRHGLSVRERNKAKADSLANVKKQKELDRKQQAKLKKEERKQREKERKLKQKEREKERKLKQEERKAKQKERERERKAEKKRKQEEAKAKKKAREQEIKARREAEKKEAEARKQNKSGDKSAQTDKAAQSDKQSSPGNQEGGSGGRSVRDRK